jgi:hypothetical protein
MSSHEHAVLEGVQFGPQRAGSLSSKVVGDLGDLGSPFLDMYGEGADEVLGGHGQPVGVDGCGVGHAADGVSTASAVPSRRSVIHVRMREFSL